MNHNVKELKTAISFKNEHGIYLKNTIIDDLKLEEGKPININLGELYIVDTWQKLSEVDSKSEAKKVIALFEVMCKSYFSTLAMYGFSKTVKWTENSHQFIFDIYPDFKISPHSLFGVLFRNVEDFLLEFVHEPPKQSKINKDKLKETVDNMSLKLDNFYNEADCIIGAGSYLSFLLSKNFDLAFGLRNPVAWTYSEILEDSFIANPFLLYWLLNDFSKNKGDSFIFDKQNVEIEYFPDVSTPTLQSLTVKCYILTDNICPWGVETEYVNQFLSGYLFENKPYIIAPDFLFPFSCPSIVVETNFMEKPNRYSITPYGDLPISDMVPKIEKGVTNIKVDFYNYPLYSRKTPVVLDTSAIDVSRFPLSIVSDFFETFIQGRKIIIPRTVMWEIKTRLKTKDRIKVEKALKRLQIFKSWKILKDIEIYGEFPQIANMDKHLIEDFRDCMVIDTALKTKAILFTNDLKQMQYAILLGVFPLSFRGLEDDICLIVKNNNLKLTKQEVVEHVEEYGIEQRHEVYDEKDIKWMMQNLLRLGDLIEQPIGDKLCIGYLGKKRY